MTATRWPAQLFSPISCAEIIASGASCSNLKPKDFFGTPCTNIKELTILGRERRPRLHKTKTAITEIKAVQLCRKHNLKDLFSE